MIDLAGPTRAAVLGPVWWQGFIGAHIAPYITAITLLMLASSYVSPTVSGRLSLRGFSRPQGLNSPSLGVV
ncbi:hypothetical protein HRbin01_01066 [archaeon HR01]|nr:hypothetical protein HRbin01_01066 [archaeon HR01]